MSQRGGMKLISPIRKLRVLRRAWHLFTLTPDRYFLSASPTPLSAAILLRNPLLRACRQSLRSAAHPRHTLGTPAHQSANVNRDLTVVVSELLGRIALP